MSETVNVRNNHVTAVPLLLLTAVMCCIPGCIFPVKKRWEDEKTVIESAREHLLIPGEKLTYDLKTGIFKLGEAELTIRTSEKNSDHLELHLLANSTHPWLPSLSYSYKSRVRRKDFSTVHFTMEEMEKSEVKKSAVFDPDYKTNKAKYTFLKRKKTEKGILTIYDRAYDYISVLYLIRKNMPDIGDQIEIPIFNETEMLNLTITNLAQREIVLGGIGKFKAFILRPKRDFEGIFFKKGNILFWLDDTYNVPLRIIIQLPFGTGKIELTRAENIKTGEVFIP